MGKSLHALVLPSMYIPAPISKKGAKFPTLEYIKNGSKLIKLPLRIGEPFKSRIPPIIHAITVSMGRK